jgi:hypothetical protein
MPDDTLNAIIRDIELRTRRGVPAYVTKRKIRSPAATVRNRAYNRAVQRALRELQRRHPAEYARILAEQRNAIHCDTPD